MGTPLRDVTGRGHSSADTEFGEHPTHEGEVSPNGQGVDNPFGHSYSEDARPTERLQTRLSPGLRCDLLLDDD